MKRYEQIQFDLIFVMLILDHISCAIFKLDVPQFEA